MRKRIDMPSDFDEVAPGKMNQELCDHYGVGHCLITRWRKATNLLNPRSRSLPADFADLAPTMTFAEMEAHWNVASKTITKWCREGGVKSIGRRSGRPRAKPRRPALAKPTRSPSRAPNRGLPMAPAAPADSTDAGQAATFLRRLYPNVFRASILDKAERRAKGVPGDGRDHFFVGGRGLLAANDMMELARSKGWAA